MTSSITSHVFQSLETAKNIHSTILLLNSTKHDTAEIIVIFTELFEFKCEWGPRNKFSSVFGGTACNLQRYYVFSYVWNYMQQNYNNMPKK